ncbi:hypothetical protein BpHYR1_042523, partial [Brachionus plicatilis]
MSINAKIINATLDISIFRNKRIIECFLDQLHDMSCQNKINIKHLIEHDHELQVANIFSVITQQLKLVLGGGQLWPAGLRPDLNGHLAG